MPPFVVSTTPSLYFRHKVLWIYLVIDLMSLHISFCMPSSNCGFSIRSWRLPQFPPHDSEHFLPSVCFAALFIVPFQRAGSQDCVLYLKSKPSTVAPDHRLLKICSLSRCILTLGTILCASILGFGTTIINVSHTVCLSLPAHCSLILSRRDCVLPSVRGAHNTPSRATM